MKGFVTEYFIKINLCKAFGIMKKTPESEAIEMKITD